MLYINNNSAALNIQNNLNKSQDALNKSLTRLSSGLRINSAKDDAAGLAISTKIQSQVSGYIASIRNVNDGISFAQTAEGALSSGTDILQRMRELSVQSLNGTISDTDRVNLNNEYQQMNDSLNQIYNETSYNGKKMLSTDAGSLNLQVGANSGEIITLQTNDATKFLEQSGDILNTNNAKLALENIDKAINKTSEERSNLGTFQNRLEHNINNLQTQTENLSQARSRIMDADFASESSNLTKHQILMQSGIAMLSQANALPQQVLRLLKNE